MPEISLFGHIIIFANALQGLFLLFLILKSIIKNTTEEDMTDDNATTMIIATLVIVDVMSFIYVVKLFAGIL